MTGHNFEANPILEKETCCSIKQSAGIAAP
jgi:hypothetical protein